MQTSTTTVSQLRRPVLRKMHGLVLPSQGDRGSCTRYLPSSTPLLRIRVIRGVPEREILDQTFVPGEEISRIATSPLPASYQLGQPEWSRA